MNSRLVIVLILLSLSILAYAQSPMPVIVAASSDTQVQDSKSQPGQNPPASANELEAAIQLLQSAKTTNEELLKTQEATLQQLDEMQKAADQLKIFSKRG